MAAVAKAPTKRWLGKPREDVSWLESAPRDWGSMGQASHQVGSAFHWDPVFVFSWRVNVLCSEGEPAHVAKPIWTILQAAPGFLAHG